MKYSRTFRTAKRYIKFQNCSRTAKIHPLMVHMGKAIQEQFKGCHEIHQGPYRQGYVVFKSNSRAVMRYTRVHTDKAMLHSRAIQGLS